MEPVAIGIDLGATKIAAALVTERGAVLIDAFKQNISVHSHASPHPRWQYWGSDMNQAMLIEFVAAIRTGRQPAVTGLDGLRAVEVTLAAYESARSGQPVEL
jgi:UDP-N-acetylglucosamine 3-dehydrogenase